MTAELHHHWGLVPSGFTKRRLFQLGVAGVIATGVLAVSPVAQARTTQIQILKREIAFGGHSFPGVGQYEVITGIASGEVDPDNPLNAIITDIELAPVNSDGNVEYQHNFYILKPVDLSKGNHKVMYEPPNRGSKLFRWTNRTPSADNDPATLTDPTVLDNSFFWTRGYTTVWSGWENNLGPLDDVRATASFPILHGPGGSTITGPGYEYNAVGGTTYALAYPAASGNQGPPDAVLTHRIHLNDAPQMVPISGWAYTDATNTAIMLTTGDFVANDIYEFSYIAKDPTPNGLGFAAVRDFNSFLRYAWRDDNGTANPLAGDVRRIYTYTLSQPARLLNDFTYLGFNEDERHRKVFDAMLQWVGAGDGLNMNYRWSQTKRTHRARQDLLYLEGLFPFANVPTFDPISRSYDSRYRRCGRSRTCPLAMEFWSSNEYWVKTASLMTTDPTGRFDLRDHPFSRNYLLSSSQHARGTNPPSAGVCQQLRNPINSDPVERALWVDMDLWSTRRIAPPRSEVPKLRNKTLVPPLPQWRLGFPNIPGVTYTGLKTTRYRYNYGPNFYETFIPTINPPVITPPYQDNPANGPIYPSYVPKTDKDGNEIAGIRLPELQVPLATYTGWALRAGVWADDGCGGSGQYIPFATTEAERLAAGDPRRSIEKRYHSYAQYHHQVVNAIDKLVRDRFLLCEDTPDMLQRLLQGGLDAGVPAPSPHARTRDWIPACRGGGRPYPH
jgi:hypothetical protein